MKVDGVISDAKRREEVKRVLADWKDLVVNLKMANPEPLSSFFFPSTHEVNFWSGVYKKRSSSSSKIKRKSSKRRKDTSSAETSSKRRTKSASNSRTRSDEGFKKSKQKTTTLKFVDYGTITDEKKAKDLVEACWEDIGKRRSEGLGLKSANGGRVVRVFVSSTFVDFHSERDVLTKKVGEVQ